MKNGKQIEESKSRAAGMAKATHGRKTTFPSVKAVKAKIERNEWKKERKEY